MDGTEPNEDFTAATLPVLPAFAIASPIPQGLQSTAKTRE